jgi:4-hydroxy-2-oxoheptanedioate aldolase
MQMPRNSFKQALVSRQPQIGCWLGLAGAYAAELVASTGFDWLLIDAEHAPNDPRSVLEQLQAIASYPVHPVVRPVHGSVEIIKQYLDLGVQTLLIPMVEDAEHAALVVSATRYPTRGIRGQIESIRGLENLEAIAAVPGVDGVFFGPADLSASMGLIGQPADPVVQGAIADGMAKVISAGKAAGSLSANPDIARNYLAQGATFVAVGVDTSILVKAASELVTAFKGRSPTVQTGAADSKSVY